MVIANLYAIYMLISNFGCRTPR